MGGLGDGDIQSVSRDHDGGILLNAMKTQYPVAMAVNPNPNDDDEEEIFVLSLGSNFDNKNDYAAVNGYDNSYRPNLTGVDYPQYGMKFSLVLQKIGKRGTDEIQYEQSEIDLFANSEGGSGNGDGDDSSEIGITLKSNWGQVYSLDDHTFSSQSRMLKEHEHEHVNEAHNGARNLDSVDNANIDDFTIENSFLRVADLKYIPASNSANDNDNNNDVLILAGTTNGFGQAFGRTETGDGTHDCKVIRKTHGFVTKLTVDGEVVKSTPIHVNHGESVSIKGICFDGGAAASATDILTYDYFRSLKCYNFCKKPLFLKREEQP